MDGCSPCWRSALTGGLCAFLLFGSVPAPASAASASGRYLVTVRGAADYAAARASLIATGAEVIEDLPELNLIVVAAGAAAALAPMAAAPGITGMALDHISRVAPPEGSVPNFDAPGLLSARQVPLRAAAATAGIRADPAFGDPGLLWDYRRIGLPKAWATSAGIVRSPSASPIPGWTSRMPI